MSVRPYAPSGAIAAVSSGCAILLAATLAFGQADLDIVLTGGRVMDPETGLDAIGADADLVVFNPNSIVDTATYVGGLSYSKGINYVIVSGTVLVGDGNLIEGRFPGKLVVSQLP
jgi:hypothetical protein